MGFNEPVTIYSQGSGPGSGYQYTTPLDLVLCDFDGDGKADLVLRTTQSDPNNYPGSLLTLTALYGDNTGHFTAKTVLTQTNSLFQIAAADMNLDGKSDLVADGDSIQVFLGHANRTFTASTIGTHGAQGTPMLADFDGNFRKDIVYPWVSSQDEIGASELSQTGSWVFTQKGFYPTGDTYHPGTGVVPFTQTFVGDYNRDGRADVALLASGDANLYPGDLHILLNTGTVPVGGCKEPAPIGIAVCSPAANSTVSNPVKFSFSANSFYSLRKMEVWVDGVKLSETFGLCETAKRFCQRRSIGFYRSFAHRFNESATGVCQSIFSARLVTPSN